MEMAFRTEQIKCPLDRRWPHFRGVHKAGFHCTCTLIIFALFHSLVTFLYDLHRYMRRRCSFLENCAGFNYNTGHANYTPTKDGYILHDTHHLGSTLMDAMISEVRDFCDYESQQGFSLKPCQQVSKSSVYHISIYGHINTTHDFSPYGCLSGTIIFYICMEADTFTP